MIPSHTHNTNENEVCSNDTFKSSYQHHICVSDNISHLPHSSTEEINNRNETGNTLHLLAYCFSQSFLNLDISCFWFASWSMWNLAEVGSLFVLGGLYNTLKNIVHAATRRSRSERKGQLRERRGGERAKNATCQTPSFSRGDYYDRLLIRVGTTVLCAPSTT